jgi:hypothetical protein
MARPTKPVSGNRGALAGSAAIFKQNRPVNSNTDRNSIAQAWQYEVYRHVNICGEARYAATLFAAMAGRAEIGISQPQGLSRKAVWVKAEDAVAEIAALAELAPTVRERSKLIRDFMLHFVLAGECYLISRTRQDTDPGYDAGNREPIWEIVAVTELQKTGQTWKVRHDNGNYIDLDPDDPVIRLWNPDPSNRREAWSPYRSMLPTLREIEWLTRHIFAQVKSRLMSAGVWFLPDNLTFPPPPPDRVEGGAEAIAAMNEAEQFMISLAAAGMQELDAEEVSFPSVVMASPEALAAVDQQKLIKFWSEIDDKAMTLRSDAVRRFALGMDLPPEQVLGSSGLAVTGAAGSAGSVNHWGVWANEEQTISAHIEPALDVFVGTLTDSFLRTAVPATVFVIGYDTATLRLRQDRSKEALEWYDRGVMKAEVALRESGFDPEADMMDEAEFKRWLMAKIASGSATPDQVAAAAAFFGANIPAEQQAVSGNGTATPQPDRKSSLEGHPYEGPPRVQHDHSPAPYGAEVLAASEVLVLRALEKAGNRLLNDGKRGRDRDRTTPPHLAHTLAASGAETEKIVFDFSLVPTVFSALPVARQATLTAALDTYCSDLYVAGMPHTRDGLAKALEDLA